MSTKGFKNQLFLYIVYGYRKESQFTAVGLNRGPNKLQFRVPRIFNFFKAFSRKK